MQLIMTKKIHNIQTQKVNMLGMSLKDGGELNSRGMAMKPLGVSG